jgi:[NiFe] hydrogenase assembly HybE family chaperone
VSQAEVELVRAFRRIDAERMRGLPISNPRLRVEAIGFRDWRDHRLGVLVTPWFMNLVLMPRPAGESGQPAADTGTTWRFPAGDFVFTPGDCDSGIPRFQRLSLYASMHEFPDRESVRRVAEAVLSRLFQSVDSQTVAQKAGNRPGKLSRRDMLRRLVTGGETRA